MSAQRTDCDLSVPLSDRAEVADLANVHHDLRLREPELHRRDQTVSSCEHFRVVAMLRKKTESFVKGRGPNVVECSRDHDAPPFSLIARHTRSGVKGMSRWRIPSGASASTTAFAMAGVAPIVPASPTPFTPSGLEGEGVSVLPRTKSGTSAARGI